METTQFELVTIDADAGGHAPMHRTFATLDEMVNVVGELVTEFDHDSFHPPAEHRQAEYGIAPEEVGYAWEAADRESDFPTPLDHFKHYLRERLVRTGSLAFTCYQSWHGYGSQLHVACFVA